MKTRIKHLFFMSALTASLGLISASRAMAQTFANLYSFTASPTNSSGYHTNSDGAQLWAGLILSGNTLYGTAQIGGASGVGTVFALNTNGMGFTNLYSFTALSSIPYTGTNSDGATPVGTLVLSGNILYGTTSGGGSASNGTVFAVNTNGTVFTNLHSFTSSDGSYPAAGLVLSGDTLYGTAFSGGTGLGSVFAANTNGTVFTNLYSFTNGSDGAFPMDSLVLSGSTLYGTAQFGGSAGTGTVFAVSTNGTGFTTLYSFTNGSDGAFPEAGLILSGNTLYGTATGGGANSNGTVFAVNTNGMGFTSLHSFAAGHYAHGIYTNSDGGVPTAGVILSGNTLYGTTYAGGTNGTGAVFAVNTNGTNFTILHTFAAGSGTPPHVINNDGANPNANLIISGNTLYGTTVYGGTNGNGAVFGLLLPAPPQLTIILAGTSVILTWPADAAGFSLQSTTNLVSPAVWNTNSPAPMIVNGQFTATNPVSGTQQFFRLSNP